MALMSPPPSSSRQPEWLLAATKRLLDQLAVAPASSEPLLRELLNSFRQQASVAAVHVAVQATDAWTKRLSAPESAADSQSLSSAAESCLAEALDRECVTRQNEWLAAPISDTLQSSVLLVQLQAESPIEATALASEYLAALIAMVNQSDSDRLRIEQLAKVFSAAAHWYDDVDDADGESSLLHKIADTAVELLHCQRASIFLWDKRRKKLIGRPAIGIEGDSLEVPDDAGVVGETLASGQIQIWNQGSDDESRVNRQVDQDLQFATQSLVAVPLIGRKGQTIGVFEALNKIDGGFHNNDAIVLTDLATHAAVAIVTLRSQQSLTVSRDRLIQDAAGQSPLIGQHPAIEAIRQTAQRVAKTELSVLVLGSNGTGKEVVAKHLHYQSDRRSGPFTAVNCAALVESLLESELFGHEKGAFTDASSARMGQFEMANGGTLFLDEIGDMSPGGQAKLLRVLEQREVVRVGGSTPIPVDVRVIAATNQPLEDLIEQKRFRQDLFFRLNVVAVSLPDLKDRGEDVLVLAEHFLHHFCSQIGRRVPALNDSAKQALLGHSWPGNVRELRNTMERICYLTPDDQIRAADLQLTGANQAQPASPVGSVTHSALTPGIQAWPASLNEATRLFQIEQIRNTIAECGGNVTEAAEKLELHRSNLYRKMKQLGMDSEG
ncbi:MAG: hypothetical protein CBB71_01675 [Rhodopirellula sp. TMED11]|nr:MAG: hypothetical protein CBB71_01675 [Rhodopirellula sp. TMED11]